MLTEASPWLTVTNGSRSRPLDRPPTMQTADSVRAEMAAPAGLSGYRPASFYTPVPVRELAPPPVAASPAKKKGWKGWNSFFRRRKANSDSSSDEASVAAAAAARRQETACVASPPPRSPVSCYPRQRPAGSAESLDTPRGLSSGSEATAGGRRSRRSAVKARVEARRSHTASSEEDEPALQRAPSELSLHRDGSLSRRSRAARTERYIRRRSRDDVSLQQEALERRRDEERRRVEPQKWAATVVCRQTENGGGAPVGHAGHVVRPPPPAGQFPPRPRPQITQTAAPLRRDGAYPVMNGVDPRVVSPSSLHPCDERYPLPAPAAAAAVTPRSPLVASASMPLPGSRRSHRPPPPPPRDPRIKITVFPEPRPASYSFEQLAASRCHMVTVTDSPPPSGSLSTRSVPGQVSAAPPRGRLGTHLSGSDQSIAQYKQQLYGRQRGQGADQVYSYTDTVPVAKAPGELRSYTDQAPARNRSRYVSQDSAFMSDSQAPVSQPAPATVPTINGASEFWRAREQRIPSTESPPPPRPPKPHFSPPPDSLASSLSEISAPRSQNTSFSCHDSDSVLGRSRAERRPLSMVAEQRPEPSEPPPRRPASEQAQRRSENFEEALDELEAIYKSLRLDDEDLLDRAERRDLPTPHQEMWRAPSASEQPDEPDEPDLNCTFSSEELSGGRWQSVSSIGSESRHRAPSLRRSAVPNKKEDDVYTRRLRQNEKNPNNNLLSEVLSQGGSYLLVSPVLSPTVSMDNVRSEPPLTGEREPDVTFDDVTFRNNRHANAVKIIDPQPPFGIPLGPTCPAAASDYLHVTPPQGKTRATFRPRRNPDLVADDLAFRALRKDDKTPEGVIDTNALDALIRETDSFGKKRAARTLSDDMSLMVKSEARQPSARPLSMCVCGGHSVSDCELEEAAATAAAAAAAAARHTRPVRLRPRPESQRTYGLYNLYVGNLSEPETSGSRPGSRGSRPRPASVTTSTETLTEAGQRRTSGEFSTKVRPFYRVSSEPEGDSGPPACRSRASTAPPSSGRAASPAARLGPDAQLDSLLEGLRLDETPTRRQHRPPRLTETLRALADIDSEKIPRAMAALDSLASRKAPAELVPLAAENTEFSTASCPPPGEPLPSSQPPSQSPSAPPPPSQPPSQPPSAPPPPSQPPSAPPPPNAHSAAPPPPSDPPASWLPATRPPAAGEEAAPAAAPPPRPRQSPSNADAAAADRKEPLSSPDGMLLSPTSRLSSARATPEGRSMTSGSDSERASERMARYKEERRRQLAARTAHLRHSSSDEEERAPGGGRPKLRRRRGSRESRPPSGAPEEPAEGAAEPAEGVRTTRASRLRAAASGQNSAGSAAHRASRLSPEPSAGGHSTAASGRSDDDSRQEKKEKDKSHRRKSNLNRARGVEEVTSSEPGESPSPLHGCPPAGEPGEASGGERRRLPAAAIRPPRAPTPELARSGRPALRRTLDSGTNFIQRRPDAGGAPGERAEFLRLGRREVADTGLVRRPAASSARVRPESTPDAATLHETARSGRLAAEGEVRLRGAETERVRPVSMRTEPTDTARHRGASGEKEQTAKSGGVRPVTDTAVRRGDMRAGTPQAAASSSSKADGEASAKQNSLKGDNESTRKASKTETKHASKPPGLQDKSDPVATNSSTAAATTSKPPADNGKSTNSHSEAAKRPDDWLPLDDKLKRLGERERPKSTLPARVSRVPKRVDTDDISARIEKLTTLAKATAVRVDRLAGPPPSEGGRTRAASGSGSSDGSESKARRLASRFEAVAAGEGGRPAKEAPRRNGESRDGAEEEAPAPGAAPARLQSASAPAETATGGAADDELSRFDSIAAAAIGVGETHASPEADEKASAADSSGTGPASDDQTTTKLARQNSVDADLCSETARSRTKQTDEAGVKNGPASGSLPASAAPPTDRPSAEGALRNGGPDASHRNGVSGSHTAGKTVGGGEAGPAGSRAPTNGVSRAPGTPLKAPARPTQIIEEVVYVQSTPKKVTGVAALRQALEERATEPPPSPRLSKTPSPVEPRSPPVSASEPPASPVPPRRGETGGSRLPPLASPGVSRRGDAVSCRPPPVPTSDPPPSPPPRRADPAAARPPPSPPSEPPASPSPPRRADTSSPDDDLPPVPPVRSNSLGGSSTRPPSILKQRKQSQEERLERGFSPEATRAGPRPILKKKQRSPEEPEPRPILKKRPSTDDELETERERPRPILKNKSVEDVAGPPADEDGLRPILKSSRSREEELDSSPEPPPSILKRRSLEETAALGSLGGGVTPRRVEVTDERPPRPILRRPRRESEPRRGSDQEERGRTWSPLRPTSSPAAVPAVAPGAARPAEEGLQPAFRASSPVPLAEAINPSLPPTPPPAAASAPMTLEQKKSLFMEFESRSRQRAAHSRPRRYQRGGRLRAERSATQPITPGEVAAAAALPTSAAARSAPAAAAPAATAATPAAAPATSTAATAAAAAADTAVASGTAEAAGSEAAAATAPVGVVASSSVAAAAAAFAAEKPPAPAPAPVVRRRSLEEDSPRLSVVERARLYQQTLAQTRAPQPPPPPPPSGRRRRPRSARFQTQPVTPDELARARVSPLAVCFAPPPDPDALGGLSFREARQLITRHGEELLQGTSAARRQPLRPPQAADRDVRGILKAESGGAAGVTFSDPLSDSGAVKKPPKRPSRPSSPEEATRGILKPPSRPTSPEDRGRGILKPSSRPTSPEDKARGILKPPSRPTSPEDKGRGILKPPSRPNSPEDRGRGILRPSSRPTSPEDKGRGILKPPSRPTSPEDKSRGILKPPSRPTSPEDKGRGILKPPSRPTSPEDKSRGILKPPSRPNSPEDRARGILKPPSRPTSPDGRTTRGILRPSSRPTSPERVVRTRPEDSSSEEDAMCGVSLADQLFNLGPRHHPTSASDPGKTVEEIAADITRRSRASAGRRPRPSAMVLQKNEPPAGTGDSDPDADITPPEIRRTGGIKDRLAALQKSGDEGWKRRIRQEEPRQALAQAFNSSIHSEVVLRKKHVEAVVTPGSDRPVSHIERMSDVLQMTASEGWKARVPENDANRFTVAGKMGQSASPCASPALARRQHNTPKAVVFRSKNGTRREAQSMYVESSQTVTQTSRVTHRQNSEPGGDDTARPASVLVSVPELADASFSAFFGSAPAEDGPALDIDWDLDAVRRSAELAGGVADRVRIRRRARTSRNPVRALSERVDLRMEYEEVRLGVGERHVKMAKVEELSRHSTFAQESLAGLAAKVDFSAVKLGRKTAGTGSFQPYRREPMLMRVKGRRHVQTRLVQPDTKALNSGDCFVLVSKDQAFQWSGVYSNVIEQSKAADVAVHVTRTHDLGCSAADPALLEYDRTGLKTGRRAESQFFEMLGGRADVPEAGLPEEDEEYEAAVVATNKVYEVTADEELVPVQEAWGQIPKYDLLQPDKVFVFDFGAELYLWTGKRADKQLRDAGKRLTRDLWDAGCDYSDCEMSPIDGAPLVGPRPDWGILGRVGQNMETILFREKFLDWNDPTRLIKVKSDSDPETTELAPPLELAPCDAAAMVDTDHPEPDLVLEMEHLGRGTFFYDEEARRQLEISTVSVKTWHVNESAATLLGDQSTGQLHQGDAYVVQWVYQVTQTGRRLGGGASKHMCVGRQRCAYFFWQGASSTVNEKGASALMVIELDQERGPQVRVTQGREPAAFLHLFSGRLVVHLGKREEEEDEDGCSRPEDGRLFVVRGEVPSEAWLLEVPRHPDSLRSRAALVLLCPRRARALLWLGAALPEHGREVALAAVDGLTRPAPELALGVPEGAEVEVVEVKQDAETAEFWTGLGGEGGSLPGPPRGTAAFTPRLFHFSCGSGRFSWAAVPCLHCSSERPCPLPYTQRELYERQQPALLLLDAGHAVYVWQGWRPPADPEAGQAAALAGAATYRWHEERRCALQTAVEYSRLRGRLPCRLVVAGLEPAAFCHLFPAWTEHTEAAELNCQEGYCAGFERPAEDVVAELTRSVYPLSTLMERPLPDGVDPVRLETYLSDEQFQEVLRMDRSEFDALPAWKKTKLKKEADLF